MIYRGQKSKPQKISWTPIKTPQKSPDQKSTGTPKILSIKSLHQRLIYFKMQKMKIKCYCGCLCITLCVFYFFLILKLFQQCQNTPLFGQNPLGGFADKHYSHSLSAIVMVISMVHLGAFINKSFHCKIENICARWMGKVKPSWRNTSASLVECQ